jgi:polyphosphate kinase
VNNKTIQYGFVSTGNLNEKTAKIYVDHLLMTSNRAIMADINKVFNLFRKPKLDPVVVLKSCKNLLVCPQYMREKIEWHIDKEIEEAKAGRKSEIIVKVNSLSDKGLIKNFMKLLMLALPLK